jgi:HEAT repeat protein
MAARHRPPLLAWLACLALLLAPALAQEAASGEESTPATRAKAAYAQYVKFVKYSDYATFSRRMAAIRTLGKIDSPKSREHLLHIVRSARVVDDRLVAITALGAGLTADTAKKLADLVASRRDPLLVQALGQTYALAESESALTWLSGKGLTHKDPGVLEAILDAQAVHTDARALPRMHELFEIHRERRQGIRLAYGALRAIGAIGSDKDRSFIIRGPRYEDWRLRLASAETMASQRPIDINIRGALRKLLADDSRIVRAAAAEGIGRAGIVELTGHVADLLLDPYLRTRAVAHQALVAMHEKELGWDPADWKRWWDRRAGMPDKIKRAPSNSVASYYGMRIHSDRLLFIVDLSGSMAFPWGEKASKTRIGVAKRELIKAIKGLDQGTLFNVIVFSDKVRPWRTKGETLATADAVKSAITWIERNFEKPEGGTFMHDALETAFRQNPEIDTIFLLTDGLATDGEPIVPEAILASVNRWNRFRRVVIHTLALTLEDLAPDGIHKQNLADIKRFMKRLATLTGGECQIVTSPPKTAAPKKTAQKK